MDDFNLPLILPGASVSKEKQTDIVIGVVVAAVVVALIAFIIILYFKRHYKEHYAKFLEPNDNFTVCSVDILYYFYYCSMHYWLCIASYVAYFFSNPPQDSIPTKLMQKQMHLFHIFIFEIFSASIFLYKASINCQKSRKIEKVKLN